MFFVNIASDLRKKKIPLWVYIFEFFADVLIVILRRRFNFRFILYPVLKILELMLLILHLAFSLVAAFIDYVLVPSYHIFRALIFVRIYM